jgi:Zn-finger nucleic acid-binding protein
MHCPRDKSELTVTRYEAQIDVDTCGACRGVWLDTGKLEAIQAVVEKDHSRHDTALLEPVKEAYVAVEQGIAPPVPCPRCSAIMDVRPFGMGSQIVIDECPEGCGIWLDGGELQALERYYEEAHAASPIPLHWRIWAGIVGWAKGSTKK